MSRRSNPSCAERSVKQNFDVRNTTTMSSDEYTLDDFVAEESQRDPNFPAALARAQRETNLQIALTAARERAGLTQTALAQRTGLTQPLIARIERGRAEPTLGTLKKLASGLGVQIVIGTDETIVIRGGKRAKKTAPTQRAGRELAAV